MRCTVWMWFMVCVGCGTRVFALIHNSPACTPTYTLTRSRVHFTTWQVNEGQVDTMIENQIEAEQAEQDVAADTTTVDTETEVETEAEVDTVDSEKLINQINKMIDVQACLVPIYLFLGAVIMYVCRHPPTAFSILQKYTVHKPLLVPLTPNQPPTSPPPLGSRRARASKLRPAMSPRPPATFSTAGRS